MSDPSAPDRSELEQRARRFRLLAACSGAADPAEQAASVERMIGAAGYARFHDPDELELRSPGEIGYGAGP